MRMADKPLDEDMISRAMHILNSLLTASIPEICYYLLCYVPLLLHFNLMGFMPPPHCELAEYILCFKY